MNQHAIGEHALLADGRTAALLDPDGNVAWMCWPRVDSDPCLYSLLDDKHGGSFTVRPARRGARVVERLYHQGTLVLRTTWQSSAGRLHVDDALRWDSGPQLVRRLTVEGGSCDVECTARFAADIAPRVALPDGAVEDPATDSHRFTVHPGEAALIVAGDTTTAPHDVIETTLVAWRGMTDSVGGCELDERTVAITGEAAARTALVTAATVLIGLHQRGGGIVAAPTTSLPQWPGTSRTWDYRYCWLRDASLAGLAMLRLGVLNNATSLASFIADAAEAATPPSVVCVDGTAPPPERLRTGVAGYHGATPVRVGNRAARQVQLDVPGEIVELASALSTAAELPAAMRRVVPQLAEWTMRHWTDPDHGIWEIRGVARRYTHSRLLSWVALHGAAVLASRGQVDGDAAQWNDAADVVRESLVRQAGGGPLQLHDQGGGADAALTLLPLVGIADPGDELVRRTLGLIASRLGRNGLLDRHEPAADPSAEPCGPFLFPTFWMASALALAGRDPAPHLTPALAAHGALGLFGEVADPDDLSPLGNYPQVQSHAACVLALTPWRPEPPRWSAPPRGPAPRDRRSAS